MTVQSQDLPGILPKNATCSGECETCEQLPESERPVYHPGLIQTIKEDVKTVFRKDPAARTTLEVLTCYPGLHAIWGHRIAHWLWLRGRRYPARFLAHMQRWLTGIEIHPAARIGRRCFIDHGMGVVIGETAEVGDDVLIYKGVVLGGTALEKTKRHPTIGDGVVIGTDAIVLGPITVGDNARIGSGSVVIKPVPADATVVGVPGKVVKIGDVSCRVRPDLHHEELPDATSDAIKQLTTKIAELESRLARLESPLDSAPVVIND